MNSTMHLRVLHLIIALRKAFVTVNHEVPLNKLPVLEVTESEHEWLTVTNAFRKAIIKWRTRKCIVEFMR